MTAAITPAAPSQTAASPSYAKHQKIYPREVTGRFSQLRSAAVFLLLGFFYLTPWLQWGNRPLILFDLPARKFWIFSLVLWPQDFIFLTWILVLMGLSLFFVTALAGRLWCGYACPQTVWSEAFIWIEQRIEGNRSQQIKRDRSTWSIKKLTLKVSKHAIWLMLSLWTGLTFVGFFVPIRLLAEQILTASADGWALFWMLFYAFAVYGNAGFLREQVCEYMCPYARFQSAMFDRDTLIITYDGRRGEPRGARARASVTSHSPLGACIDCTLCVQVCPTGIDIRQGLQYQCIACAACIDVCDSIMDKMEYPRGLIRYTTQNAIDGVSSALIRPRIIVYAALLLLIFVGGLSALVVRKTTTLDVLRDRNALYRVIANKLVENVYTLKIINKDLSPHTYRLSIQGLPQAELTTDQPQWLVDGGEVLSVPIRIDLPQDAQHGGRDFYFVLTDIDQNNRFVREQSRFIAP